MLQGSWSWLGRAGAEERRGEERGGEGSRNGSGLTLTPGLSEQRVKSMSPWRRGEGEGGREVGREIEGNGER